MKAAAEQKKETKKTIIVRQKNGTGFIYTDVSTALDELSKQDCVDLITMVLEIICLRTFEW